MKTEGKPLLPEIGVIALVVDHWGPVWQSRHHVLSRLAKYFQVVWVTPAPEWRDVLRGNSLSVDASTPAENGLAIYNPPAWLSKVYRPRWLGGLLSRLRLRAARRLLTTRGCTKIMLYLWRPDFADALTSVPHDFSCYHIDDEYTFSDVDQPIGQVERQLIADVDQVFIHSPGLLEKKGHLNPATAYVPNGVDYAAFSRHWAEPEDLKTIPHPRIGYTGWVKRTLDWPMLLRLTEERREWSFVFVGPQRDQPEVREGVETLLQRGNVHFLGAKHSREVPAYTQYFDVCIMPYQTTAYAKYGYPLKLHEYLASGRPTVGTRMRTLEDFSDVVSLAAAPDEWSSAITAALTPEASAPERSAARQAVARRYDWDVVVAQIARTLANRLGENLADQFPDDEEPDAEPWVRREKQTANQPEGL